MFKRQTKIIGLLVLVILLLAGCSIRNNDNDVKQPQGNQTVTSTIKIGFIAPLSGDAASIGKNIQAAVKVATDEINQKGGINGRQVKIIYEDGKCDAKEAIAAGNKLINSDKVQLIIGGACSDETLSVAPIAEKAKVVLFSPASTNPKITDAGDYVFRNAPSDNLQGKYAAEYIYSTLGKKTAAILYTQNIWGSGIKDVFSARYVELGGKVLLAEAMQKDESDARSSLTKIKQLKPEALYMPTLAENGIVALKQIKELGLSAMVVGGDVWDDTKIPAVAKDAAEGVRFTVAAPGSYTVSFTQAMKKLDGGETISSYAARAYDAAQILFDIIGKVGDKAEDIKTALYKVNNFKSMGGTYSLDLNGDLLNGSFAVKQFKDGKIMEVK